MLYCDWKHTCVHIFYNSSYLVSESNFYYKNAIFRYMNQVMLKKTKKKQVKYNLMPGV